MFTQATAFIQSVRKSISGIAASPLMKGIAVIPPVLSAGLCILWLLIVSRLPPVVPFYYSRPWGEEQLVPPVYLLLLPAGSLLWYVLSLLFIHFFIYQYRVFAQLVLIAQTISTLACVYIFLRILFLVL